MKFNILGKWSAQRLIPTILWFLLMTNTMCHYGDLSDVDSTFQSMFKNFSSIFDSSAAPRELTAEAPSSAIKEVQFTDEDGNLKAEDQIKKEIEEKFNVHNADSLGIDSVIHDLVSKGVPQQSNGRKLGGDLETKIQRAMNLGLGGEILSQNPELKEKDLVKKNKNWVEFDNSSDINDQMEKSFDSKKDKGTIQAKTWGSNTVKHRIGENGLKSVETIHKSNKIMKKTSKNGEGSSSIQTMSFSSSSSSGNPGDMKMPEMNMNIPDYEDPEMNEMFFPEEEIKKMNEMQAKMMGNLDDLFTTPEEFAKVTPPRELRQKRRRKKSKKTRKRKRKNKKRKLENYDYDYPESVYGYNSHIIENPVNCPDCGESSFVPKINYDMVGPNQELNQFQENNYIDQQSNMNQQNMQQNNINHYHNHYHHPAFDPSLSSNIGVEDYDKMEKLYQDYLDALTQFNHEVPTTASPKAVNKQMTVIEHQLANHHQKNPYFGSDPITLPPMMSTDSELAMHLPSQITQTVIPKETIHHHYIAPSYNEYTFHAMPVMPVAQAPTPEMIHNYQLLMDMPHPMAAMVPPVVEHSQVEETHEEIQHMKKDLEIEFKNDLQIEVGNVIKHEDELQKHTDDELDHLIDLTRSVQNSMTAPAPTLNVEHTVMGVDGHQIHETKDGEIIVENNSESHSIKDNGGEKGTTYGGDSSNSSEPSEHTEVIQKVTPIIIGNPGAFGGSDGSYSTGSSSSYSRSSSSSSRSHRSKDEGSEEVIIQKGDQITQQHMDNTQNDHDEDHSKIVDSSSDSSSEVHAKNSIYNEKNTHIVHHMGAPSDSKVLNIHLDLLSDGKGGFYFQDKNGKPIGSPGTFTEKYDVLNHQLDSLRTKEVENFKQTGKMSESGQIGDASPLNNLDDNEITTQINQIDDLHEVTNEDLKNIGKDQLEALKPSDRIRDEDDLTHDESEGMIDDMEVKSISPLDKTQESSVHQELESSQKDSQISEIAVDNIPEQTSHADSEINETSQKSVQSNLINENEITPEITSESQLSEKSGLINEDEITTEVSEKSVQSGLINEDEISPEVSEQSVQSGLINEDEITPEVSEKSIQSGLINEDEITTEVSEKSVQSGLINEDEITAETSQKSGLINEDEISPETSQKSGLINEDEISPETSQKSIQSGLINEDEITPETSEKSVQSGLIDEDEITPETTSEKSVQSGLINEDEISPEVSEQSIQSGLINEDEITPEITSEAQLSSKSDMINEDEISPEVSEKSIQSGVINEDEITPETSEKSVQSGLIDEDEITPETSQKSDLVNEDDITDTNQSELVTEDNITNTDVQEQSGVVDEDDLNPEVANENNQSAIVDEDDISNNDAQEQSGLVDEDNISNTEVNVDNQSGLVDEDDISNTEVNVDNQSGLVDEDDISNTEVNADNQSGLVDEDDISNTEVNVDNQSGLVDEDDISNTEVNVDNQSGLVDEDDINNTEVNVDNQSGLVDEDDISNTQNDADNQSGLVDEDDISNAQNDTENQSGLVDEDDLSPKGRVLRFRREEKNLENRENPFKHKSPIFEEMSRNFLTNPPAPKPRSMREIADQFDKNFGNDKKSNNAPKFVEPRELFENLDVTAKLRSKLGIGSNDHYVKDYKPLF
jgi:hypothetical protein